MSDPRRSIPSVDVLLEQEPFGSLLSAYPRARVVEGLRSVIADVRERLEQLAAPFCHQSDGE